MLLVLPTVIEPERWIVAFHKTSKFWWVRWLAAGAYKHVSAFAFLPLVKLWVYYDVTLAGTKVLVLPDSKSAEDWIAARTADADLVSIKRQDRRPSLAPFYCVSAIKSLIGLRSSALRPEGLFRDCLAAGAELIDGTARSQDRSDDRRPATRGSAGG